MTPSNDPVRGLYCNRTLNLRRIKAIGYDMDYTLIHYYMRAWEERAYTFIKEGLQEEGWPVEDLTFDPDLAIRGLIIDCEEGNIVKANRFGYVKRAFHGTEPLSFEAQRETYQRTLIDLRDDRWIFLNTLFAISEACMYMQLVELLDDGQLGSSIGYGDLYERVRRTLDQAHMEGRLKEEIIAHPDRFVDLDEEMPLALLDQKEAGKKLLLITNSEWSYAAPMLQYAVDAFLPGDMTWHDLFDIAIVGARKPSFFSGQSPAFRVVSDDGMLREQQGLLDEGEVYVGGHAALVERTLGLSGEEILYVGDHLFVDVNVSKNVLRWRTALIVRELEDEISTLAAFTERQQVLSALMEEKEQLEAEFSALRLRLQRSHGQYGPHRNGDPEALEQEMRTLRERLVALDAEIAPIARQSGRMMNPNWGLLMRTGKDKSHFARQVERYADIYTGRVSNFLHHTPFVYLRSHRGSLPHDDVVDREFATDAIEPLR